MGTITKTQSTFNFSGDTNQYSGSFIPFIWSAKLNAKFYSATVFGEIANTDWEGEITGVGDKVVINAIPDISIKAYTGSIGTADNPAPITTELNINRAKYFHFNVQDVIAHQARPNLMNMFTDSAAQRMKMFVDSSVLFDTFVTGGVMATNTSDPYTGVIVQENKGPTAGRKSASYNLGTNASPIVLTSGNVLQVITALAGVLDEQDIPDSDRWLVIDPQTRTLLMNSNLAQAQFMGDDKSIVRNGKIGMIDRFTVYVSNQLPFGAAGSADWFGAQNSASNPEQATSGASYAGRRRLIIAGHKSGIAFASQLTKVESLRNPNNFGDLVRGLQVYGSTIVKGDALAMAVVSNV